MQEKILIFFKKEFFHIWVMYLKQKKKKKQKETKGDLIALNKQIIDEEIDLNEELFEKHFKIQRPIDICSCI